MAVEGINPLKVEVMDKLNACNQNGRNLNYHLPFFEPGLH